MTKEVGTLREIGARVGDVVEYVGEIEKGWTNTKQYELTGYSGSQWKYNGQADGFSLRCSDPVWRIIRRAVKSFNVLTAEEKGALMLANHEGKIIEMSLDGVNWERSYTPQWIGAACYRVEADEVKEVRLSGFGFDGKFMFGNFAEVEGRTHRITFNLVNGKPDCASVKMEEIN